MVALRLEDITGDYFFVSTWIALLKQPKHVPRGHKKN